MIKRERARSVPILKWWFVFRYKLYSGVFIYFVDVIFTGILLVFTVGAIALVFHGTAVIRQTHIGFVYAVLMGLLLGYVHIQYITSVYERNLCFFKCSFVLL